jgi:hypothetical protein
MLRITTSVLGLGMIAAGCHAAVAQDIAGIEDCTKIAAPEKRTGCLQSNINFLQRLVTKNALEAEQRLNAAASEIMSLKKAVTTVQTELQAIKAIQKPTPNKKPE